MKKIMQYVGAMNRAGAETLLMNLYRNIDRNKYEFHFISHTKDECDYDEEIKCLGGKIVYLERPTLKNLKKYENNFKKIVEENGPYTTIHAHMQFMNGLALKNAEKNGICNRISHAHLNGDYTKDSLIRKIYRKKSRSLINKYSTQKLACSDNAGTYLYENNQFILFSNAVDLNNFCETDKYKSYLHNELNLSRDIKIITHIGRFVEAKNHKFILKVFSELIKSEKNYRLVLCGEGPLENEIKILAKDLNIEEYIYFLGIRTDINKILMGTDIYFMPSLLEGLPVALIEAQAAGCSCLISENIPKQCDIKLGVINRKPLEEHISLWIKTIKTLEKKKIEFNVIAKKMNESGYSLSKNLDILDELYI